LADTEFQTVGQLLCYLRGQAGWSQAKLADAVDLSKETISNYEREVDRAAQGTPRAPNKSTRRLLSGALARRFTEMEKDQNRKMPGEDAEKLRALTAKLHSLPLHPSEHPSSASAMVSRAIYF